MHLSAVSSPVTYSKSSLSQGVTHDVDDPACNGCNGNNSSSQSVPSEPLSDKVEFKNKSAESQRETDVQTQAADPFGPKSITGETLTRKEQMEVRGLRKRDQEVRAHEQAHIAAGAGVTRGGPRYEFERGPDGGLYAVEGEVSIDTSEARTPEETIRKMERVKAAALAPANPSSQDRRVAAQAAAKAQKARAEIASESQKTENTEQNPSGKIEEKPENLPKSMSGNKTSRPLSDHSAPVGSNVHLII